MSQCPSCQNEIVIETKDMGALFTCPRCQAVYFINFDGVPEYDPAQAEPGALESMLTAEVAEIEGTKIEIDSPLTEPSIEPVATDPIENFGGEFVDAVQTSETLSQQPLEPVLEVGREIAPKKINTDLKEIVDFGNAVDVNPSGILVSLTLSGLDSKHVVNLVKEAITDSRFMWDTEKIMSEIDNGELRLHRIPPLKAALVVARLRFEDVKISWEQNEI